MTPPAPSGRSRSTTIYFLIAAVTIAAGLAIMLGGAAASTGGLSTGAALVAVGTSVLAGGLTSAGLGLLRYFDDKDQDSQRAQLIAVSQGLVGVQASLANVAMVTSAELARSVRIENSARLRTFSDLEVGDRFKSEYLRAMHVDQVGVIEVDVAGLKLYRFLSDQLDWMIRQGRQTRIRLLLQDPTGTVFQAICELEGRSEQTTRDECVRTLLMFPNYSQVDDKLTWASGQVQVELRHYGAYQPVTLFRVNNFACVRARVSTPRGAATRFYEAYDRDSGEVQFQVQSAHFDTCWEASKFVPPLSQPKLP